MSNQFHIFMRYSINSPALRHFVGSTMVPKYVSTVYSALSPEPMGLSSAGATVLCKGCFGRPVTSKQARPFMKLNCVYFVQMQLGELIENLHSAHRLLGTADQKSDVAKLWHRGQKLHILGQSRLVLEHRHVRLHIGHSARLQNFRHPISSIHIRTKEKCVNYLLEHNNCKTSKMKTFGAEERMFDEGRE